MLPVYLIKIEVMLKIVCHPITKKKNTKKVGVDSSTTDFWKITMDYIVYLMKINISQVE